MKRKHKAGWVLLGLSRTGSILGFLITMDSACIVAEYPQMWVESLVLAVIFGSLTVWLYQYSERMDCRLHMTRLQILQAAQEAKKEMPARNCSYGQAKVAN